MRKPFPQKKSVSLQHSEASLTYLDFGSAGGNPDRRADTHMWTFSYMLPMRKTLLGTRPAKVLSGSVSVICPTHFEACRTFGREAWDKLTFNDRIQEVENHFQNFRQHLIVTDVDDSKKSIVWKGFPRREIGSAVDALAQLVFMSQSSFSLNRDDMVDDEDGVYPDTLRLHLSHPRGRIERCYLAPETNDEAVQSCGEDEVLPRHLRTHISSKSRR